MRRPRYIDFICPTCETKHTRFVETNDDDTPLTANDDGPIAPEVCHENSMNYDGVTCDGVLVQRNETIFQGYMKTIVKGSHDFNERERERLEKRGDEHWKREGRHEAIERERAMLKKNGMEGTGGVR
jgi:hypothetical protein